MNRPFVINFKNYPEISGEKTVELARAAEMASRSLGSEVIVAPPQAALALVAKSVSIPVICQHLDDAPTGSTTGFFLAELAKSYGASGSLINHSEHRLGLESISNLVAKLRKLDMTSIVCAGTAAEVAKISRMEPDFIAIEPPELIGSGKAVSRENPAIITESVAACSGSSSKLICGAGISEKVDVSRAMELGSRGILLASGIIKASSWKDKIVELASAMK